MKSQAISRRCQGSGTKRGVITFKPRSRRHLSIRTAALMFAVALMCLSVTLRAAALQQCEGAVLERRVALVQFGEWADRYIASNETLPNICEGTVSGVSEAVPALLSSARLCGSSKEGVVYYQCELEPEKDNGELIRVIEMCSYSLKEKSLSCVNNTISATLVN